MTQTNKADAALLLTSNRKALGGLGLLSLMPLFFSSAAATLLLRNEALFQAMALQQWLSLFLLSSITMALAITPSTFIALAGGYFLGWQCTLLMALSYLLASALGFQVGRWLDGGQLLKSVQSQPKARKFLSGLTLRDWPLMILVRLSPVLPFALMNLLMPALNIRFRVFLVAGFLGMLPRTLFSIWLGIQAKGLMELLQSPEGGRFISIVLISLTILSLGGLLVLFQRTARNLLTQRSH